MASGKQKEASTAERHARFLLLSLAFAFVLAVILGQWLPQQTFLHVVLQPLILVAVMFGYKKYCLEELRLTTEDTGDSVYYLGFLFTITSLSAGLLIIGFRLQQTGGQAQGGNVVISLLPSFAAALITTIVGLCIRVTLSQQVGDPTHVDAALRDELHRAAAGLKEQADLATDQFSRLVTVLKQKTSEIDSEFSSYSNALQALFRGANLQRPAEEIRESAKALRQVSDTLSKSSLDFGKQLKPSIGALVDASNQWNEATAKHSQAVISQTEAMEKQARATKNQLAVTERLANSIVSIRGRSSGDEAAAVFGRSVRVFGWVFVVFVLFATLVAAVWTLKMLITVLF